MQNNRNELDKDNHKKFLTKAKDLFTNFKTEWMKGKYYMLKNKEQNVKSWKEYQRKYL